MDEQSERLEDALGGRYVPGPQEGELRVLVNLASEIAALQLPGPDDPTRRRLDARFERMIGRDRDAWWVGLVAWLGIGPAPRPFVQRLAAGLVLLTVGGGAASGASGVSPMEAASGVVDFAGSAVRNLDPRDSGGNSAVDTPTPSATPSAEPPASATVDASATTASETPPAGGINSETPGTVTPAAGTLTPTAGTSTPTPGTSTPTAGTSTPTVSPTEDDDFETETPDDGSDDNGGDIDRDDRTEPGDDRDSTDDDDDSGSDSGGDDS